jgi:hypothetical protein
MISLTHWNWQQPDWPGFVFDPRRLAVRESAFMHQAGVIAGAVSHFGDDERLGLVIMPVAAAIGGRRLHSARAGNVAAGGAAAGNSTVGNTAAGINTAGRAEMLRVEAAAEGEVDHRGEHRDHADGLSHEHPRQGSGTDASIIGADGPKTQAGFPP